MIIGFKNRFYFLFVSIISISCSISYGQKTPVQFINYLYESDQYKHLVDYVAYYKKNRNTISDTTHFLLGKSHYKLQNLTESTEILKSLPNNSIYFTESRFLMHINSIYLNNYQLSYDYLDQLIPKDTLINDLKNFELSGLALLNRNIEMYKQYDNKITNEYYFYTEERDNLQNIADNLSTRKLKSPWVAGMLTAIVPGSGKFYAGKRGQGIYSFVISMFLALQTWESYNKDGLNSPRFIAYGSLFSLFHAGNIWSSALSVKNYNNEFNEAVDYRIKMDMHIPIRAFFD